MDPKYESELISKAKNGDVAAFEQLIEEHKRKVVALAFNKTGNLEDAYDVAQEVFIKLFRHINKFDGKSQFSTWVYKITYNTCLDEIRKKIRKNTDNNLSLDEKYEEDGKTVIQIKDERGLPEDIAIRSEKQKMVREAIAKLSEEHREVLIMREFEDMTYDDIAAALNCTLGTVKSRINRAKAALKNILSEHKELFLE